MDIPAEAFEQGDLVFFEYLYAYKEDGTVNRQTPISLHEDINDKEQTVKFVKIGTQAQVGNLSEAEAKEEVTITDVVEYHGLDEGKEYVLVATPKSKETEQSIGKPVKETFTATGRDGFAKIDVKINAMDLAGQSVVMFEEVYDKDDMDEPLAEHKDINDEAQTVHFPEIGTKATVNGVKEVEPGKVEIVDTITYTNFVPGKHTFEATLTDPETGKPMMINGKAVVVSQEFTLEKPSGTVQVKIPVDASKLDGKSIVIFEKAIAVSETVDDNGNKTSEEVVVARHENPNDKNQTVTFVKNPKPNPGDSSTSTSSTPSQTTPSASTSSTAPERGKYQTGDRKSVV